LDGSILISRIVIASALFLAPLSSLLAVTFKPQSSDQIIATLPASSEDPRVPVHLRKLRAERRKDPSNIPAVLALTDELLELGRLSGAPRFYGEAEAALSPWWSQKSPPTAVLLRRANIYQFNHQFELALQDLGAYLKATPEDGNARIMEATILMVLGRYTDARESCKALPQRSSGETRVVRAVCELAARSMLGEAQASLTIMKTMYSLPSSSEQSAVQKNSTKISELDKYIKTVTSDMSLQLNDLQAGQSELTSLYAGDHQDRFTAINLSDLHLDAERYTEASQIACPFEKIQGAVLRCARAMRHLDSSRFSELMHLIELDRESESRRDSNIHLREAAYFFLYLKDSPREALVAAEQNFRTQREPIDARLLLESAYAAKDFKAAKPALDWMKSTGYLHGRFVWLKNKMQGA